MQLPQYEITGNTPLQYMLHLITRFIVTEVARSVGSLFFIYFICHCCQSLYGKNYKNKLFMEKHYKLCYIE